MSHEPVITLFSSSLLSKWGFNDGDTPDQWWDYCDAHAVDYREASFPLVDVVQRYLIPRLDQTVTVHLVETGHNPIRVDTVDGVDVTEEWYGRSTATTVLTPEYVDVPLSEVLKLVRG